MGGFAALTLLGWVAGVALERWFASADVHLAGLLIGSAPELIPWVSRLTWLGSVAILAPLTLAGSVVLWLAGRLRDAIFLALALAGAIALTYLVKDLVDRSRPAFELVQTTSTS